MALTRVNGNLITSGTITGSLFDGATITGDKIGLTAITSNLIASAAVTGDKIGLTAINANNIVNASITGNKIGLTAITSNLIATGVTLTSPVLASANLTTALTLNGAAGTNGQVLTSAGSGLPSWTTISSSPTIVRSTITANTTLVAANASTFVDVTSGTITLAFTAAATLGSGWFCYIRNSGTGDTRLDPNASELIDGLTSYIMYPGEARLVQCTGTAFTSVVLSGFTRTFTTSGTFVKPPGYLIFEAFVWSGGCSGGRSNSAIRGGPGGGGFPFTLPAANVASSETVTVGSGGTAQTGADNSGNAGGASSIGTLAEVAGAQATQAGNISIPGYGALVVNSGTLYDSGFAAGRDNSSVATSTVYGGASGPNNGSVDSGSSFYGGAAGGSHDGTTARLAGTSKYGGNGGNASVTANGVDGTAPGGGGGSAKTSTSTQSGAGARGEIRIRGVV
jgi:hypothetical protein